MDTNVLAKYLDQYDKLGMGGGRVNYYGDSPWSGSISRDQSAATEAGLRTGYAQRMAALDQQPQGGTASRMPDYFAGQPQPGAMPYRSPDTTGAGPMPASVIARQAGFAMAPGGQGGFPMAPDSASGSSMGSEPQSGAEWQQMAQQKYPNGPVYNYLANLLKGR